MVPKISNKGWKRIAQTQEMFDDPSLQKGQDREERENQESRGHSFEVLDNFELMPGSEGDTIFFTVSVDGFAPPAEDGQPVADALGLPDFIEGFTWEDGGRGEHLEAMITDESIMAQAEMSRSGGTPVTFEDFKTEMDQWSGGKIDWSYLSSSDEERINEWFEYEDKTLPDWLVKDYEERAEAERAAGTTIEINNALTYIAIDFADDPDGGYFFQGDEADNLLKEVPPNINEEDYILAQLSNW